MISLHSDQTNPTSFRLCCLVYNHSDHLFMCICPDTSVPSSPPPSRPPLPPSPLPSLTATSRPFLSEVTSYHSPVLRRPLPHNSSSPRLPPPSLVRSPPPLPTPPLPPYPPPPPPLSTLTATSRPVPQRGDVPPLSGPAQAVAPQRLFLCPPAAPRTEVVVAAGHAGRQRPSPPHHLRAAQVKDFRSSRVFPTRMRPGFSLVPAAGALLHPCSVAYRGACFHLASAQSRVQCLAVRLASCDRVLFAFHST